MMSSSSSEADDESDFTPVPVKLEPNETVSELVPLPPEVSKERYFKNYEYFIKWRDDHKLESFSESVLLSYFIELSKKLKPSSLWSNFSMLKSIIHMKHGIDMKDYDKLLSFIKKQSAGFISKKSKVFTAEQVHTFINEAPDEIYLAAKICLIFGISGACRTNELVNITVKDIETQGNLLLIKLPKAKSKTDRTFMVRNEYVQFVNKYLASRPEKQLTNRFFLKYTNGRCLNQVIGKNKLACMPRLIAKYLNLPNLDLYTGQSFRKTSATLLAHTGADLTAIKKHLKTPKSRNSSSFSGEFKQDPDKNKAGRRSKIRETIYLRSCTSSEPLPGSSRDCDSDDTNPLEEEEEELEEEPGNEETRQSEQDQATLLQNIQHNIDLSGKPINLTLTNCSHITFNFH